MTLQAGNCWFRASFETRKQILFSKLLLDIASILRGITLKKSSFFLYHRTKFSPTESFTIFVLYPRVSQFATPFGNFRQKLCLLNIFLKAFYAFSFASIFRVILFRYIGIKIWRNLYFSARIRNLELFKNKLYHYQMTFDLSKNFQNSSNNITFHFFEEIFWIWLLCTYVGARNGRHFLESCNNCTCWL